MCGAQLNPKKLRVNYADALMGENQHGKKS